MTFSDSQEVAWQHCADRLDRRQKLWFIVLKGRQTYMSTFFQALTFVRTMEQPGTHSLVIAQDLDTSHVLFEKSRLFYDRLPLPKLRAPRIKEIEFPFPGGASRYRVISAGVAAKGRGTTQTCVHMSETAFWQHPEFLTGMLQAMPDLADTFLVIESTANGKRGHGELFYREWLRAVSGESDLIPIFIPWTAMPKYRRSPGVAPDDMTSKEALLVKAFDVTPEQLAWRRFAIQTKTQGDADLFDQEYPISPEVAFIATGQPAFDREAVLALRASIREPISRWTLSADRKTLVPDPRGALRVWHEPQADVPYVIGADTAEALRESASGHVRTDTSGDYAAAEILDMRNLRQVASIHGRIPPWDFADWLAATGRWYNKALLAVEINNHGHTTQERLMKSLMYPNLHRWQGHPDRFPKAGGGRIYGWNTNAYSRPLLIDAGRRVINTRLLTLHEEALLAEIDDFSLMDTGKYEAEYGHDDRVIALLIALRSREENYHEVKPAPAYSAEDLSQHAVRTIEERDTSKAAQRRRMSKILRDKAQQAVRHWMQF